MSPYPGPRSGPAAIAYQGGLIGQSRNKSSDTIVFGGQDVNGKYLSEVWLLRAYNGVITQSGDKSWEGFGDGQLQSGSNASGTGVTNTYLGSCATQLSPDVLPPSSTSTPSSPTPSGNAVPVSLYDVSVIHKTLAPISIALVLPMILAYRLSSPSLKSSAEQGHNPFSTSILLVSGFLIFGLGITGLVTSFTSISYRPSLVKRDRSSLYLRTGHGIAGAVLSAAFYVAFPVGFLLSVFMRHHSRQRNSLLRGEAEKITVRSPTISTVMLDGHPDHPPSTHPPSTNHSRSHSSTGLLQFWKRSMDQGTSVDADEFGARDPPSPSPRPTKGFEVVNRPKSTQRASSHSMSGLLDYSPPRPGAYIPMRLKDMSWLNRRRMVNTVVSTYCSWYYGVFTGFCAHLG